LDTHILLWAITDPGRLAPHLRKAMMEPGNGLWFSAASYWEICIKQAVGKLCLKARWPEMIDRELERNQISWLAVEKAHCTGLLELPNHHRDPFDRLLIAQAKAEEMVIATMDKAIHRYAVKTL
jgi:PIN domain nuclease of toxin-antitoxin system